MHLHNAWLPPPVAEETWREKEAFAGVVKSVKEIYNPNDPESVYSTLKWVSVIHLFVKAKSELSVEDVTTIVEVGLELFQISENKLYAQVRWGKILVKLLNKYRKKLSLKVQWRPLYDILIQTHFTRNPGPEGWRLRHQHFQTVTSLVRSCRRFFPSGSASEIWSEFRSLLENPWHNASFEGAGFVRLFLPTNLDNQDFFEHEWVKLCLDHWGSIPNCRFWNRQWASVTACVIKNYHFIDWEHFLPDLFNIYLNMFEVPVANGSGSYPFPIDVPRSMRFLFENRSVTPSKAIAKSIVYMLKPGSTSQKHFEKLANPLEQFVFKNSRYYHPSNGGRWTYSLEQFLFHLVNIFQKRIQHEQLNKDSKQSELFMAESDRACLVTTVLKFIDRGQYSKNDQLSETVAAATSILSYVEPSLVLPFLASHGFGDYDNINERSLFASFCFSEWLDEFLCRLFALLQHLEPSSVLHSKKSPSLSQGIFFLEQLQRSNPQEAVVQLIRPILESVISDLKDAPTTGFGSRATSYASSSRKEKTTLSPALETAAIEYKEQFKQVIASAFDSTSWKVNPFTFRKSYSLLSYGSVQVHFTP